MEALAGVVSASEDEWATALNGVVPAGVWVSAPAGVVPAAEDEWASVPAPVGFGAPAACRPVFRTACRSSFRVPAFASAKNFSMYSS